jgi:hypothetical protein
MDAARLIATTRHALAHARDAEAVIAEAWQAHALVEVVGGRLTSGGGGNGPRAGPVRVGLVRAGRLTCVRDPVSVLRGLLEILAEVATALVEVARSTEEVPLYWRCVEAADAADDATDQVRLMLTHYEAISGGT